MSPNTPPLRTHRDKALLSLQRVWLALAGALLPAPGIRSLWRKLLAVLCLATLSLGASAQNRSYEFKSNDAVVLTNAASALSNRSTFTIEFWAKFTSVSGTIGIFDITGGRDAGGLILNSGTLTVDLSCDFGCLTESNALSLSAGTWYHIATVFDNGTWDFYVDGVAQGTNVLDQGALTSVPDYANATPAISNLRFGLQNHSSVDDFVGSLDDIRLWSSARTQTQIQTNRSRELVGNEADLIGYWKLNESIGPAVQDSQTNATALHGTSSGVGFNAAGAFNAKVVSVTSSTPNGTYKIGGTIGIQVNFSAPVTVTGTPQLILETGATDRAVNYAGGSGSSTLNFQYTVQPGDNSADLDYVNSAALSSTGGTIRDADNNDAILTLAPPGGSNSLASNQSLVIDGVMPAVTSMVLSGGAVSTDTSVDFRVNFSESVVNISTDDFDLGATGTAAGTITSVSATSGSSVTVTVSGITGNGAIKVNLKANTDIADAAGNSAPAAYTSGAAHPVAIPTAPGAPTIGTATAGDGQVRVTFTAPGSDGGSVVTTYTATANPGGAFGTCAGPAPCIATVTGLGNGTAYTFTVTATNSVGTSVASGASNAVTPKGNQTITFEDPGAQNFGTSPTVSATASSGLTPTFTSSTTGVCTITSGGGLAFVTAGLCTIHADQPGNNAWNAANTTIQAFTVDAVVPGAPTIGTATAGDTQATVSFAAPASTGGAAIIAGGYTVTAAPNGATGTGSSSPIIVTGLTNGVAYTFTVTATNSAGTGAASASSNSVTPAAPQTITFGHPGGQNFGTTPTLTATSSAGGGYPVRFTSSTTEVCTITNGGALTFVTAGTCTINADQAGDSSYLAAPQVSQSFTVAPVVPGAPTSVVATAGDTQVSVAFLAPVNTGGSAITSYTVTVNPPDVVAVSSPSSPIVVTGLTNGQAYTFTVTARNAAGAGAASVASNSVVPKAAQTITFANPGAQNFGTTPTLTATSGSGLAPVFSSSTTGVCTITGGGALTFVAAGTCTINADQPGNSSYLAATQVSHSFAVQAVTAASGSVPGMVGQATATLSGGGPGCTLDPNASGFAPAVSHTTPAGQSMAHGEFAFEAAGCTAPVTMTLVYPEPLPVGVQFWKYGPEVAASNGVVAPSKWFLWAGATPSVDGKTVVYTITDNGVGDADPAVGRIRDPLAAALPLGGPGGAVGIPADAPWALALLSAAIGGLAWRRRRAARG